MSLEVEMRSPLTSCAELGSAEGWMDVLAGGRHAPRCRGRGECRDGKEKGSSLVVRWVVKDEVLTGWGGPSQR